jgi:hypothetical protein
LDCLGGEDGVDEVAVGPKLSLKYVDCDDSSNRVPLVEPVLISSPFIGIGGWFGNTDPLGVGVRGFIVDGGSGGVTYVLGGFSG